ncbi:MAG: hypothetical protein GX076_03840 [Clostridiales bacterium]|nr:hypothetical protein [Clostridiales bacterium]
MCTLGKIAACEISFLPIQSSNANADVNKVIELIEQSGLEYSVGAMSTLVRGQKDIVFNLLEEIYAKMDEECKFVITAKISNICGCEL